MKEARLHLSNYQWEKLNELCEKTNMDMTNLIRIAILEFVEKQWSDWQDKNSAEHFEHIDTEHLTKVLIDDLTYASKMDVREYTLYQKWCEVQERYPVHEVSTLFGSEIQMVSPEQKILVDKVKSNFWMPESPDDYEKLKPIMVLSNGELAETWNAVRTFSSTMKNNSNIGRNLFYTVTDEVTGKYLGVICISSDFLDLTPRDNSIGWSRDVKTQQGMINHTAIGSTIVPLQPLGFNYMGGKLLALMCLSDTVQKDWKRQYGDVLAGVTTTSLYGNTKSGGLSQYDGLDHWNKMGFSSGSVAFEPSKPTKRMVFDWIKENYPRKYFEWWDAKNLKGLPFKRDHKNRSLNFAYGKLKIPKQLIRTEHQRGIYFSPLYDNTSEFLRKEITEDKLVKSFDTSEEALANIWKTKYAKGRISMLKKKNTVSYESLFYDDLIYLSWEETKAKYLPQVGR
jgi:hypothetical protein